MKMTETDENLMLAVTHGDVEKLAVLFDRYHRSLFDFFAKLTGNRTVSEDLVQDVFFRILKYRETFRKESHFKAWMFHIARNARIDHYRKHGVETTGSDDAASTLPSTARLPGHDLEQEQQTARLECALQKLPFDKREVLVLSRYQDMKYEQIAELLGCEVSTIKVRVFRAIRELRDIFFRLENEKQPCNVKRSVNNLRII
jgi:RNA polymerase sigma-70 factor (ECF subfamily)